MLTEYDKDNYSTTTVTRYRMDGTWELSVAYLLKITHNTRVYLVDHSDALHQVCGSVPVYSIGAGKQCVLGGMYLGVHACASSGCAFGGGT